MTQRTKPARREPTEPAHTDVSDETPLELAPGHPLAGRVLRRMWRTYVGARTGRRVTVWRVEWDAGGVA